MTDTPLDPSALQPVLLAWTTLLRAFQTIHAILSAYQPILAANDPEGAAAIYTANVLADLDLGSHVVRRLNPAVATPGANWRTDLAHLEAATKTVAPAVAAFLELVAQLDVPTTGIASLHEAIPDLHEGLASYRQLREN